MRPIDADELMKLYESTPELDMDILVIPVPVVRQNILDMPTVNPYEWISMEDDKPKKNGYYFCYHMTSKRGDKEDWQINKLYWEDNLWLYHHNSFKVADFVTHWMPLPESPKK